MSQRKLNYVILQINDYDGDFHILELAENEVWWFKIWLFFTMIIFKTNS